MPRINPYRDRIPHTYEIDVVQRRLAIKKPFKRWQVYFDSFNITFWSIVTILDLTLLTFRWYLFALHLAIVAITTVSLSWKLTIRKSIVKKQVTR